MRTQLGPEDLVASAQQLKLATEQILAAEKQRQAALASVTAELVHSEMTHESPSTLYQVAKQGEKNTLESLLMVLRQLVTDGAISAEEFQSYINHGNHHGQSAVVAACLPENDRSIQLLLEYGATPTVTNSGGCPVALLALSNGLNNTARILLQSELDADLRTSFDFITNPAHVTAPNIARLLTKFIEHDYFVEHIPSDQWHRLIEMSVLLGLTASFKQTLALIASRERAGTAFNEYELIALLKPADDRLSTTLETNPHSDAIDHFRFTLLNEAIESGQFVLLQYGLSKGYHDNFTHEQKSELFELLLSMHPDTQAAIEMAIWTRLIPKLTEAQLERLQASCTDNEPLSTLLHTVPVLTPMESLSILINNLADRTTTIDSQFVKDVIALFDSDINQVITVNDQHLPAFMWTLIQLQTNLPGNNIDQLLEAFKSCSANINFKATEGADSLFIQAIKAKFSLTVLQWFIDQGALVTECDHEGATALEIAIKNNDTELAAWLVKQDNTLLNQPNSHGITPLIMAIINLNSEMVSVLISSGAKCTQRTLRYLEEAYASQLSLVNTDNAELKQRYDDIKTTLPDASELTDQSSAQLHEGTRLWSRARYMLAAAHRFAQGDGDDSEQDTDYGPKPKEDGKEEGDDEPATRARPKVLLKDKVGHLFESKEEEEEGDECDLALAAARC